MEIKVRSILQQALDDLNALASVKKDEEIYIDQTEAKAQALLEYIADLQRKEYNNSKAIEYIDNCPEYLWTNVNTKVLLNILEKGE